MSRGSLRRGDKAISLEEAEAFLQRAACVTLATVDEDGVPYAVPNLFVYSPGLLQVHTTASTGHFRQNVAQQPAISFSAYEIGEIYPYGAFECDTTASYASVVGFGTVSIEPSESGKAAFFDRLMAKYGNEAWDRPAGFYPRLGQVTVFNVAVAALTGKLGPLPVAAERWPAVNRSMTPNAIPPAGKARR